MIASIDTQQWPPSDRRTRAAAELRAALLEVDRRCRESGEMAPNRVVLSVDLAAGKDRIGAAVKQMIAEGVLSEAVWRRRHANTARRQATRGERRAADKRLTAPGGARAEAPWHVRLRREILACERRIGVGRATA